MTEYTVATFLKEKVDNMINWLRNEGAELTVPSTTGIAVTALAQALHDQYAEVIKERLFDELMADKENLPLEILKAVQFVHDRPPLHDKFWRYLTLFSDTVSKHG